MYVHAFCFWLKYFWLDWIVFYRFLICTENRQTISQGTGVYVPRPRLIRVSSVQVETISPADSIDSIFKCKIFYYLIRAWKLVVPIFIFLVWKMRLRKIQIIRLFETHTTRSKRFFFNSIKILLNNLFK
jgi:hypothetical protein